jgi:hypothetical protein
LKRKLRIQCPCGYVFDVLSTEKDALVQVRRHFDRFHKDFLPFGITETEALSLIKNEGVIENQKSFSRHLKQNSPMSQ